MLRVKAFQQESVAEVAEAVPVTVVMVRVGAQPVPGTGPGLLPLAAVVVVAAAGNHTGSAAMAATGSSSSARAPQPPPTR